MSSQPRIIMITGNMAAGKSSVAQALAERLEKSVHLRGDLFRRLIVRGQAEMSFELSTEAVRQLELRYKLAAAAARLYLQEGFTVVYQDIVIGEALSKVLRYYQGLPLTLFVLCPRPEVIAAREAARSKKGYASEAMIYDFDRVLRQETPHLGTWLDSSDLSLAETVEHLLQQLNLERPNSQNR